jgi:hypothetical protein
MEINQTDRNSDKLQIIRLFKAINESSLSSVKDFAHIQKILNKRSKLW